MDIESQSQENQDISTSPEYMQMIEDNFPPESVQQYLASTSKEAEELETRQSNWQTFFKSGALISMYEKQMAYETDPAIWSTRTAEEAKRQALINWLATVGDLAVYFLLEERGKVTSDMLIPNLPEEQYALVASTASEIHRYLLVSSPNPKTS